MEVMSAQAAIIRGAVPADLLKNSGYGSGSGYGDGYGSGSGYGDGYGSEKYWLACLDAFAAKWPRQQQARLATLRRSGATIAYWRSDEKGKACNGGRSKTPVAAGTIETVAGPLKICTSAGLHATIMPPKHQGDRWWIVALSGEVQWSDDKCAALTREVLGECL